MPKSDEPICPRYRTAVPDDSEEIVRLAGEMHADMAEAYAGQRPEPNLEWARRAASDLQARIGRDVGAFVAEGEPGQLLAVAVGTLQLTLPSPRRPTNVVGYIEWVSTSRDFRNQGHATALTDLLIHWFNERDASVIDLHASASAEGIYLRRGFGAEGPRALSLRLRKP